VFNTSVIILSVTKVNVVRTSVAKLSVIMWNVVAPFEEKKYFSVLVQGQNQIELSNEREN
jgi:hypothetical protein